MFLQRLGELQVRRAWTLALVVALSLIPAALLAGRLEVRSSFTELLPEDKPSVIEMRRVDKRMSSRSTLTVVAEAQSVDALKRFMDALAARVAKLELVSGVETGTRDVQEFFEQNKHLYVSLSRLKELHEQVVEAFDARVQKAAGLDLGLDSDDETPKDLSFSEVQASFEKEAADARKKQPGIDGYYIGDSGGLVGAVLVRTSLGSTDPRAFELRRKIDQVVRELDPKSFDPKLRVNYTGNLITSAEQHQAVVDDLAHVGLWGVGLILGVVFLFFLRFRVLLLMSITIAVGALWTFGLVRLTIGYLNTATGFLFSIIVGNGINFGIIYMARYIEARRDEKLGVSSAISVAHRETYAGTLAAAVAALVAYGSLSATDFRGFRHFGVIGAFGMVLCWIATYLLLPALLVITERQSPMFENEPAWRAKLRGVYGYPWAWLSSRIPRVLVVLGVLLSLGGTVLGVRYFISDPMEYNFRNLRNDQRSPTSAGELAARVDPIIGRLGQDGRAIVVDRLDQVQPLVTELLKRRDRAPQDQKPFSKVVSIFDLLPKDQDEKITLLRDIRDRVERGRKRRVIADDEYSKINALIPPVMKPLAIEDLPPKVAQPFTESDGSRGKIVYIAPTEHRSIYNVHYLLQWADSFREVKLANGEVIRGTGDPVIYADMLINVREDAPRAVLLSLFGTLLVTLIAFGGRAAGVVTLVTLLVGLSWLTGFLALRDVKLNFLNFVALPISIGVGADYALNVMKRRQVSGDDQLERVVIETGGAVTLCSMTTTLGYLVLLLSINGAVRSFGMVASVGEITTLLAAVLVLPSALMLRHRARLKKQGERQVSGGKAASS